MQGKRNHGNLLYENHKRSVVGEGRRERGRKGESEEEGRE